MAIGALARPPGERPSWLLCLLCCSFYGLAFFSGYERELTPGQDADVRRCLYWRYLWSIMLIEDKVRFGGADHIPWVRDQFVKDLDWLRKA